MKTRTKTDTNITTHFQRETGKTAGRQIEHVRRVIESEFGALLEAQGQLVKLGLNEAEALAVQTPYPQLVFPTLAEEKLRAIVAWQRRQEALRSQQHELAFAA